MAGYSLVLSIHKTGSSMLCNMLDSHPALSCPHEYLDIIANNVAWREALGRLPRKPIGHVQAKYLTRDMLTCRDARRLVLARDPRNSALSHLRIRYEILDKPWRLDPNVFREEVENRRRETAHLLSFADEVVSYEELTGDSPTTEAAIPVSAKLCRFFGVETLPLKTQVKKNTPSFPVNWDELKG